MFAMGGRRLAILRSTQTIGSATPRPSPLLCFTHSVSILSARSIVTSQSNSAPSKLPKAQLKTLKPSSKINARTSRLLRSQLDSAVELDPARVPEKSSPSGVEQAKTEQGSEGLALEGSIVENQSVVRITKLKGVNAFATASSYDLKALIASCRLPPDWQLLEDGQAIYLPSWPVSSHTGPASFTPHRAGSGEVFILRSGAYVTWGLNPDQAQRFRSLVLTSRYDTAKRSRHVGSQVESAPYEDVGEEEMEYLDDSNERVS